MRIGWHVPLPGPFSAGGTVYRSRRGPNEGRGCAILIAAVVVIGGGSMLIKATHGLIFLIFVPVAVVAIVRAVYVHRKQAPSPASIADKSLTHMERTCDSIDLAAVPADDLRTSFSSLDVMETAISDNLTGAVQHEAQQRVSWLRERLDAALAAQDRNQA